MGLQLTLAKENNRQYFDYVDAYWSVDDIGYTTQTVSFRLNCYPSREAKYKNLNQMPKPTLSIGSAFPNVYDTVLYSWEKTDLGGRSSIALVSLIPFFTLGTLWTSGSGIALVSFVALRPKFNPGAEGTG